MRQKAEAATRAIYQRLTAEEAAAKVTVQAQQTTQLAIVATAVAHHRAAAAAITDWREAARAKAVASESGALAVRQAMEVERLEVDHLGSSYVRVRVVQESAAREMAQLGHTGVRALTGVRQEAAAAAGALGKDKDETAGFGKELLALAAGQAGLHVRSKNIGSIMAQTMKDVAEWTARTAKDFVNIQKSVQGIAAPVRRAIRLSLRSARSKPRPRPT